MLDTTGSEACHDEDSASESSLALRLSAVEATLWCWLGFQVEDDSQDQRGAEQISQIGSHLHELRQKSFSR